MDALQRFNEILSKIPNKSTHAPEHTKRVTFEATAKPTPRVAYQMPTPRVANATPTPRVSTTRQFKVKTTIDKPILTKERTKAVDNTPGRT